MTFLTIYIIIAVLLIVVGCFYMAELGDHRKSIAPGARLTLSAFVWPVLVPVLIWWLVCAACEREFPTFEPKQTGYRR